MMCDRCEGIQMVLEEAQLESWQYEQKTRWQRALHHFDWAVTIGRDEFRRGVLALIGRGPGLNAWR